MLSDEYGEIIIRFITWIIYCRALTSSASDMYFFIGCISFEADRLKSRLKLSETDISHEVESPWLGYSTLENVDQDSFSHSAGPHSPNYHIRKKKPGMLGNYSAAARLSWIIVNSTLFLWLALNKVYVGTPLYVVISSVVYQTVMAVVVTLIALVRGEFVSVWRHQPKAILIQSKGSIFKADRE